MSGIDVGEGSTRVLIYNSLGSPPFSTPAGNAVKEDRAGDGRTHMTLNELSGRD
jgi:hypothetical protein